MVKQAIVALVVVVATQAHAGVCSATHGVVVIKASCTGNMHDQLLQAVQQHNKQQTKQGYIALRTVFDAKK